MYKYLFRQTFREWKTEIKNYKVVGIALIVFSGVFLGTVIRGIYSSGFSLSDHLLWIGCVICAVQLLSILFQKTLVFTLHPAAMHNFFNSGKMRCVKRLLLAKKTASKLVLSFLICLVLYNFRLEATGLWLTTISLFAYLLSGSFIRWFKYHKLNIVAVTALYACSSLLFVLALCYVHILASMPLLAFCLFTISYSGKVKLDWGRYYDDALFTAKLNHASRHRDMAEMQQITAEHIAKKKHALRIYNLPLNKRNALFCKALIESMRAGKQVIVILGLLLVFAVLLNKTTLFAGIPFIGEPNIARAIGMLAIATFFSNLMQQCAMQISAIHEKHKMGFFVPYTYRQIVLAYGSVCCLIACFVLAALCCVFAPGWIKGIAAITLFNGVMILYFLMLTSKKAHNVMTVLSNLAFILGAGMLLS